MSYFLRHYTLQGLNIRAYAYILSADKFLISTVVIL